MTITSMVRNGYRRRSDGNFVKLMTFPTGRESGNGINHAVELVTRDRCGKLLRTKTQNKRRKT